VHAKSDAEVIAVRPILGKPNVTMLRNSEVTKLETDSSGRTVTGVVVSRGGNREVYQGDIVAVCAGAANSARLLLNGPALSEEENPMGNIQMVGKSNAEAMRGEEPHLTWFAPEWSLDDVAKHSVDWWLSTDYSAAIAAGVLTLIDLLQPANYSAEDYRLLWTLCGVAIAGVVMLLAGLLAKRTVGAGSPVNPIAIA
jgi:choline dehydrogenase-like flavoprotein